MAAANRPEKIILGKPSVKCKSADLPFGEVLKRILYLNVTTDICNQLI
jgi:hypothetical protein